MCCGRCCVTELRLITALRHDIFIEILLDQGSIISFRPKRNATDHRFLSVAGCATGSARLTEAPTFTEASFNASTLLRVSYVLFIRVLCA
jgi:hypothetical protein